MWSTKYTGLRGLTEPEAAHMRWNGFNRSVDRSGLRGAVLKASTMCQRKHGPYHSGTNRANEKECLELMLRDNATPPWLAARADLIFKDRCMISSDVNLAESPDEQFAQWEEYMKEPSPGFATWLK